MPVVAVFNSNEDTVEMLRLLLEHEGFQTVAGTVPDIKHGRTDLLEFVEQHRPDVIVYDVSPPLEQNWTFLRLVQNAEALKGCGWVITSTNKEALEELVGEAGTFELLGKPEDLKRIVEAVRNAASRSS